MPPKLRKSQRYTPKDGLALIYFLKKTGFPKAKLIGSLGRGKQSTHDIDILLPTNKKTAKLIKKLTFLLEPKDGVSHTDWGGLYFHKSHFGDVDVFFTTKDFDY